MRSGASFWDRVGTIAQRTGQVATGVATAVGRIGSPTDQPAANPETLKGQKKPFELPFKVPTEIQIPWRTILTIGAVIVLGGIVLRRL